MNPDGTAADTRQNAHGVDLNRNFPYRWERITDPTYYSGPYPASEPETQAAMHLILKIRPAVTIWYHQQQDLVGMAGGDRGVARRYAHVSGLRATCLPFLPGTASLWSNHRLRGRRRSSSSCPQGRSIPPRSGATSARLRRWSAASAPARAEAARRKRRSATSAVGTAVRSAAFCGWRRTPAFLR